MIRAPCRPRKEAEPAGAHHGHCTITPREGSRGGRGRAWKNPAGEGEEKSFQKCRLPQAHAALPAFPHMPLQAVGEPTFT